MNEALDTFCTDIREILSQRDDRAARDQIRQRLESLLTDETFCGEYVADDTPPGVTEIYQDAELGFCVLAYNMAGPRKSPPHDHGSSWAVYGQARGYTDMTIWQITAEHDATHVDVEPSNDFRLNKGEAGLFDVGEIHSIEYEEGAKFVRVTGTDMKLVERRVYDHEEGTVKIIEQVGTGTTGQSQRL